MTIAFGQGGGGKKSGGKSEDDTLRSVAHAIVIDAVSEGPIEGLVDGANSIYINKTPLANIDDSTHQFRRGLPDDAPLKGINGTEAYQSIGVQVNQDVGPQVRTVVDTDTDLLRIYMTLASLYHVDSKGGMKTANSGWRIDVRAAGQSFERAVTMDLNGEKCTSAVQFQHNIRLSDFGPGPWDIRLSARYGDRTGDKTYEQITWDGMSLVTEAKLSYPNTALVGLDLSAEHVGSSMPSRHYHIRGRRIRVPVNYDPVQRNYTGTWDGTFKTAWCNNPAWIYHDIVTNKVFGLGNEFPNAITNKWQLYAIAQHCDAPVPTGYLRPNGTPIREPRYYFNGVITDKKSAIDALRSITAVWRGMGFYSASQFYVTYDAPQDPAHVYGPANVLDGRFEYSNSSSKARHTVVMVRFNDENDFFESAIEPVIDDAAVRRFGWKEKQVELTGCSSRSLARRYGRWILDTEQNETETVTFSVGMDSIHALPGEVIAINDPRRAQVRMSGRIAAISGDSITLDQPLDPGIDRFGVTLRIQLADGTLFTRAGNVQGNMQTVHVGNGNGALMEVGAVYVISASNVAPREYRIVSIDEEENGGTYRVTALQFDRTKFARVERGITLEPKPTKLDRTRVRQVRNLTAETRSYVDGGGVRTDINLGWQPPEETLVREYTITVDTPTTKGVQVATTNLNSATYATTEPGVYKFNVRTVNVAGNRSKPASVEAIVTGGESIAVGRVEDLVNAVTGRSTGGFTGPDLRLRWRNMMAVSQDPDVPLVEQDPAVYAGSLIRIYSGATLLREQTIKGNSFTYSLEMNRSDAEEAGFSSPRRSLRVEVAVIDRRGRTSLPTQITMSNPAPAVPVLQVGSAGTTINLEWDEVNDPDLDGYLVWIRTNATFDPVTTRPTAIVKGNTFSRDFAPATEYFVVIAAYDAFGRETLNYSSPVSISTGIDNFDTDAPDTPTNLQLSSTPSRLTATWGGGEEVDFSHFEILISTNGGAEVGFSTTTNRYHWDVLPNTPVTVRVCAVDAAGNKSAFTEIATHTTARDTTPPAVPTNLTVRSGFGTFWLKWDANQESDLSHYEVYESQGTVTPAAGAQATYQSASPILTLTGLGEALVRNFWVRAVDTSGNASAWSARQGGQTSSIWQTQNDATTPTGLGSSTRLTGGVAYVRAFWNAASNASSYEIGVREDGGNEIVIGVGSTNYEFIARAGVSYAMRVLAVNNVGRKSSYTSPVTQVAATDSVAPAVPPAPTLRSGFGTIFAEWARNTEADFSHYDIAASSVTFTTTAADANIVGSVRSNTAVLSEIPGGEQRFVRIRAVDTSGNTSAWSGISNRQVIATPDVEISAEDLNGLVSATSFAAGIEPVTILSSGPLPTTKSTSAIVWNGNLYRWSGTAYTTSVATMDLTGQITGSQIAAGAVNTQQLAARAISTEKMMIGLGQSLFPDPQFQSPDNWSFWNNSSIAAATAAHGPGAASSIVIPGTVGTSWVHAAMLSLPTFTAEQKSYLFRMARKRFDGSLGASRIRLLMRFHDAAGVFITQSTRQMPDVAVDGVVTQSITIDPPALSAYCLIYIQTMRDQDTGTYIRGVDVFERNAGELTVDGSIRANHLSTEELITVSAQIRNAIITDAHVTNLSAAKLTAGTALASTLTVSGEALSSIRNNATTGAQDPALRINAGITRIDPGRISISGSTTLADWRRAGDVTKIDGGAVSANTISANKLTIGNRGITLTDTKFEANPATNTVTWTAGYVRYITDNGGAASRSISAGSASYVSGAPLYIYWAKDAGQLSAGNAGALSDDNSVVIATYRGGLALNVDYGRTVIDGAEIRTGSIRATNLIQTESLITASAQIAEAIITDAHVLDLSAAKLTAGTALAGSITVEGRSINSFGTDSIFDDATSPWNKVSGAGTGVHTTSNATNTTGTHTMVAHENGPSWWESSEIIPYDPSKLYRVTFSVRRYSGTTGQMYLGLAGFGADRTTRVNQSGADSISSQFWMLTSSDQSGVPTSYTDYVGYFRGKAANFSGQATIANPKNVHNDVRFVRPIALFNYNAPDGARMVLNHAKIEVVTEEAGELVNTGTTQIDPGKIRVSGNTTLADWRYGGDNTQIDGGNIAANTVTTNKLVVGLRGITLTSIMFEHNKRSNGNDVQNWVRWIGGFVRYTNDSGNSASAYVTGDEALWTSGVLYIYWIAGETQFRTTTSLSTANRDDRVIIATYQGDKRLDADYGRTVIDGDDIKTGTITATQLIKTAALITDEAQVGNAVIDTANIKNAAIARAKIGDLAVNTLKIADGSVTTFEYSYTTSDRNAGSSSSEFWTAQNLVMSKGRADPLPMWYRITALPRTDNYANRGWTEITLRLRRNGTLIDETSHQFDGSGNNRDRTVAGNYLDIWTGTSTVTYTLEASIQHYHTRTVNSSGGQEVYTEFDGYGQMKNRFIGALNAFK